MYMCKNILIAFDGSGHSHQAAKFAAEIAKALPDIRCSVITVLTFTEDEARFLGATRQDYESAEKEIEHKYFGKIKNYFNEVGVPLITVIRQGDPAKEIIKYAQENTIDLIFLGPRGLGNIEGVLLGSVSSKIIHTAKCPVTLVKDQY